MTINTINSNKKGTNIISVSILTIMTLILSFFSSLPQTEDVKKQKTEFASLAIIRRFLRLRTFFG
jgi:hypothetical protein